MPMRMRRSLYLIGVVLLSVLLTSHLAGPFPVGAESGPEGKSDPPKPKEGEDKPKEAEPKPKEADSKPAEPKVKEPEVKPKDGEPKAKDPDSKPKEADAKPKESESKPKAPDAKPKESTPKGKEGDHKPKESEKAPEKGKEPEHKAKESDGKAKEKEADPAVPPAESPCPSAAHVADVKPSGDGQVPTGEAGTGEHAKPESEAKKPIRSSMVTAKLALMADPRLFPYDIEVDAKDKDLVLLGKVAQDSDKRAASEIVGCLDGVHAVENRLKVEADALHGLSVERDKMLTQLVKERFEKSKTLQSVKFDVKTEDGIVILSGQTRFQVIVLEAAQAARQVPGVRAVTTSAVRLVAGE